MPDPFHFELVSPERLMFSGEVEAVIVPGTEGQFTVLKDHAPLMTRLKPGIVEVDETATQKQRLFVRGGFADVAHAVGGGCRRGALRCRAARAVDAAAL